MAALEIVIPQSIIEVIEGDQKGYELVFGYGLQINELIVAHVRAVVRLGDNIEEMVFTDDLTVLEDIKKLLPSKPVNITKQLFYANKKQNICFEVADSTISGEFKLPALKFITREVFDELLKLKECKFEWQNSIFH